MKPKARSLSQRTTVPCFFMSWRDSLGSQDYADG
jgi:hypothetical protein